ncbi:calcium-binding protein [Microvirga lotononidis]|uniref:Ca2+-binding protein, RTX toxin n=1 Tax=Microvirga lotononidis TaxID=864069 RepID=I4YZB7_9HYPH|nr:calcium-binding protein [Microvirga lotononidis]EIM29309.1 Ca2+-binding protein, RTX toxin [Microvirga lotononidis]WQO29135.1 hypothetical protein U0023_08755 [Microvirga lotononidis]
MNEPADPTINAMDTILSDVTQLPENDEEASTQKTGSFAIAAAGNPSVITGDYGNNDLGSHSSTTAYTIYGDFGNDTLRGGTGNDKLYGDDDNDLLIGWRGNDTLDGGEGYDAVSYETETGGTGVVINLTGASWTYNGRTYASMTGKDTWGGIDSYVNVETFIGSQGNDIINASDTPDQFTLYGGAGNDTLMGAGSNEWDKDYLIGGAGDDLLIGGIAYFQGNAAVRVDLATGTATGQGTDTLQSITHVIGSNSGDVLRAGNVAATLDGAAGNDTLYGSSGNDELYVGSGADVVYGSAGSDLIYANGATTLRYDQLVLLNAQGNNIAGAISADLAQGYVSKFDNVPGSSFPKFGEDRIFSSALDLVATQYNDAVTGNNLNNHLYGLGGNDSLGGAGGDDVLTGDAGNDTLDGGTGNDTLDGGINNDLLKGGDGHDRLLGGSGRDTLDGGNGDDTLDGGNGADSMVGGAGNDIYYVDNLGDSVSELADGGNDTVYISVGGFDHLKLANIENVILVGEGSIDYSNRAPAVLGASGPTRVTVADTGIVNPFANLTIDDNGSWVTVTVKMNQLPGYALGTFTNLGPGAYDRLAGTYTVSGDIATVQAALRGLQFDPNDSPSSAFAVGTVTSDTFTITVVDDHGIASVPNSNISVDVVTQNRAPILVAPTAAYSMSDTDNVNLVAPFAGVAILEANQGDMITVTIALDSPGKGTLTGTSGTYNATTGVYTVTASASSIQSIVRTIKFNPTDRAVNGIETTKFTITVSDAAGASSGPISTIQVNAVHGTAPANSAPVVSGSDSISYGVTSPIAAFTKLTVSDSSPSVTATVAMDLPHRGTFVNLGSGSYDAVAGTYTVTGTAAQVQTAIRALQFNALQTATVKFTVTVTDGSLTTTNANFTLNPAMPNRAPIIQAQPVTVRIADDEDDALATPFASVALDDPEATGTSSFVQLRVYLDDPAKGVLVPGKGGTIMYNPDPQNGYYYYTISGKVQDVQAALRALEYNPRSRPDAENGSVETSSFTIRLYDASGLQAIDNNIRVESVHGMLPNAAPVIGGADAPVAVNITDADVASPFSAVTISDDSATVTVTITMDTASEGEFTNLGIGTYNRVAGTYTVTGTVAQVQAAIQALQFDPENRVAPAGSVQTTNFTISIVDEKGVAGQANGNISVASVASNIAPTAPEMTGGSISDMAAAGSQVGTLSASDANGDAVTYTFSQALAGSDGRISADGRFEIVNNLVVLRDPKLIQVAQNTTFTYGVIADDGHGGQTSGTVSIAVADINKAPANLQLSKSVVQENVAEGYVIGLVSASDPNGTALSYTLLDDAGGGVELVGNQLRVKDATKIDFEQHSQFAVTIAVSDGLETVNKTFTITVEDERRENVVGNSGDNVIRGGSGNDTLNGAGGNDTLHGGEGRDQLIGGAGADTFVFDTAVMKTAADSVLDFSLAEGDRIWLSQKIFIGLGLGQLTANAFALGTEAHDQDDRIIYDQATGRLFFDVDGASGSKKDVAPILFAILNENGVKPALTYASFFII